MAKKLSLAGKYRPQSWEMVVEQDVVKVILNNQIKNDDLKRVYLFCGSAGVGKTSMCRLLAKEINNGLGMPIELDCATHNSVEDVRAIIEDCKVRPLQGKYKVYILDECFVPETEVLTDKGFKQFKDLDQTEKIAQYTDDGKIEFVNPIRYIKKYYEGEIVSWQPRSGHIVKMTPNHQQPLYYIKSKKIKTTSIKDTNFTQAKSIIVAGKGNGRKTELSNLDRLAIVCSVYGYIVNEAKQHNRWVFKSKNNDKIEKIKQLIHNCGITCKELSPIKDGSRQVAFNLNKSISKEFTTYFDLDITYEYAREFLDELFNWGGYRCDSYLVYSSTNKINTDYISAVATLGGYNANQTDYIDTTTNVNVRIYRVKLFDKMYRSCEYLAQYKTTENYTGEVYCVEVPSHKIIVRADGYTFVSGNCHMITLQGWSAFLKILEEPPPYVIFMLATTDPQKLLPTILSRVQRFNFTRISVEGIRNQLLNILQQEGITQFEYSGIDYIARLADGGMRSAITLLEECLDYSNELTLDNILKVTAGGLDEVNMQNILDLICMKDSVRALQLFTQIYNSGVDVSIFIKMFKEYIVNCIKYLLTRDVNITVISEKSVIWLNNNVHRLNQLKQILSSINSLDIRYSSGNVKVEVESWLIEVCS